MLRSLSATLCERWRNNARFRHRFSDVLVAGRTQAWQTLKAADGAQWAAGGLVGGDACLGTSPHLFRDTSCTASLLSAGALLHLILRTSLRARAAS